MGRRPPPPAMCAAARALAWATRSPSLPRRIQTAATIAEAIDAYAASRYAEAHKYVHRRRGLLPSGKRLRVYGGLYLTSMRLKRTGDAARPSARSSSRDSGPAPGREVPCSGPPRPVLVRSQGLQQPSLDVAEGRSPPACRNSPVAFRWWGMPAQWARRAEPERCRSSAPSRVRHDLLRNVKIDAKKVQARASARADRHDRQQPRRCQRRAGSPRRVQAHELLTADRVQAVPGP